VTSPALSNALTGPSGAWPCQDYLNANKILTLADVADYGPKAANQQKSNILAPSMWPDAGWVIRGDFTGARVQVPPRTPKPVRFPQNTHYLNTRARRPVLTAALAFGPRSRRLSGRRP
jgi:hypothetical protein